MVDEGVADGRIAQSCESTQQDPLVKDERCDQDTSATIPAATEANKEPVATFSVAEIQEARSSLFRMAVPPGSGTCLLYTSPSPRDRTRSRMPSSA